METIQNQTDGLQTGRGHPRRWGTSIVVSLKGSSLKPSTIIYITSRNHNIPSCALFSEHQILTPSGIAILKTELEDSRNIKCWAHISLQHSFVSRTVEMKTSLSNFSNLIDTNSSLNTHSRFVQCLDISPSIILKIVIDLIHHYLVIKVRCLDTSNIKHNAPWYYIFHSSFLF